MKTLIKIPKQILILIILAVLLIAGRVVFTGSQYYIFLIWNIFLAFVPFVISGALVRFLSDKKKYLSFIIVGGILWLFTFPNAPYLVTDVIHLRQNHMAPVWFDAMLLFVCAWIGMIFALYSLEHIEKVLLAFFSKIKSQIILAILILISSFGIYVGRFLRWNSWDVVASPNSLSKDIWIILSHPSLHLEAYGLTFSMFLFIGLSYIAWKYRNK